MGGSYLHVKLITDHLLSRSVPDQKKWFSQTIHTCKTLVVIYFILFILFYLFFFCFGGGVGWGYSLKHISPVMTPKCQWVEIPLN